MADRNLRRLPFRQLLVSSDKTTRDLADIIHVHLLPRVLEFRELTRPIRRKSQYPTVQSFQNGLKRLLDANDRVKELVEALQEHLDAIRDHAQRERLSRLG